MTLNNKYCYLVDNDNGYDNQLLANKCEKIADDFAIAYSAWYCEQIQDDTMDNYSLEELLEIYKREKEL